MDVPVHYEDPGEGMAPQWPGTLAHPGDRAGAGALGSVCRGIYCWWQNFGCLGKAVGGRLAGPIRERVKARAWVLRSSLWAQASAQGQTPPPGPPMGKCGEPDTGSSEVSTGDPDPEFCHNSRQGPEMEQGDPGPCFRTTWLPQPGGPIWVSPARLDPWSLPGEVLGNCTLGCFWVSPGRGGCTKGPAEEALGWAGSPGALTAAHAH